MMESIILARSNEFSRISSSKII